MTRNGIELRSENPLADRAKELLTRGPMSTGALAEALLGAKGSMSAAATVIFSLLGTDARFAVDARGLWSLVVPPAPAPAASLLAEEWVVVDVETTGGSPHHGHRITEVAAVWVSGGEIRETFSTLVNPLCRIPAMITALTGITDEMVRHAPPFAEIAPRFAEAIRGRVFVAHNAAFDWRFVCAELERTHGQTLAGRQLCTVRLARKLLPELSSRTLDALAVYFGVEIEARHRALDDAVATAKVLVRLFDLLAERDITDWYGVERFLSSRAPHRTRKRRASPRSMDSA